VEDLPGAERRIAVQLEKLRKHHPIGMKLPQAPAVAHHAGIRRIAPRKHRRTRWIAQRILAIRPIKLHPRLGQRVDVGGDGVPAEALRLSAQIIGDKEQHIIPRLRRLPRRHPTHRKSNGRDQRSNDLEHSGSPNLEAQMGTEL
jgi:hypothetical protein